MIRICGVEVLVIPRRNLSPGCIAAFRCIGFECRPCGAGGNRGTGNFRA
jgi:hypothetical protein